MRRITRDKNHKSICDELSKRGVQCLDLSGSGGGVTDIVTYFRGKTVFLEIKFGKDAKLKKTQAKFLSEWRGFCGIALNIDEAYALATKPEVTALNDRQKNYLAGLYLTMDKETRFPPVMRELEKIS
jgi:Holliday junction resolvase